MTPLFGPRTAREVAHMMGLWGIVALVAILVALVVVARQTPSVVRAIIVPATGAGAEQDADAVRIERFRSSFDGQLAQITGRSMFFIPAAPPLPSARTDIADTTPRPPTHYGGPAIVAMINGAVWFADGRRFQVGDEGDDTLSVISVDPPWGAIVRWRSMEFEVSLFERTTSRFMERETAPSSTLPELVEDEHASNDEGDHESAQVQEKVPTGEAIIPNQKDPA